MILTALAVLICLGLFAFGAVMVREGDLAIAARPDLKNTVRTNQVLYIITGGVITMVMFVLCGVAFAPRAQMLDWTPTVLFTMPFAPSIGALIFIAARRWI